MAAMRRQALARTLSGSSSSSSARSGRALET
jgi:hypothetical protein